MRRFIAFSTLALLASSCSLIPRTVEFSLEPNAVRFPAQVTAGEPLAVQMTVVSGGCSGFSRFEAKRTANTLSLQVIGTRREGMGVACDTGIYQNEKVYTDPGTPARTNPFEVVVNGKSWGKVNVQ